MTDKRILVWTWTPLLARSGGPSTYLYNLRLGLNSSNFPIDYLPDLLPQTTPESSKLKSNRIKTIMKNFIPAFLLKKLQYKNAIKIAFDHYNSVELSVILDLKKYAAIHFHNTIEMSRASSYLKNYTGDIIFTPHTPCPPYQHELNHLNLIIKEKPLLEKLIKLDFNSFKRANIIILPCKNAIDSYYNGYLPFENLKDELNLKQIFYIPTGTPQSFFKREREDIRKEIGIPSNAFVIHFAGRHNYEKGYDILIQTGEKILNSFNNVYFLITGKENDKISKLNHKRWIEIGWTEDPFSYANASDLFVLPNRETYFDLVLIEMLSIGIPVLLSEIGGNLYFKERDNKHSISFFQNNLECLTMELTKIISNPKSLEFKNNLYNELFTLEKFTNRYKEVYEEILKKHE